MLQTQPYSLDQNDATMRKLFLNNVIQMSFLNISPNLPLILNALNMLVKCNSLRY